MTKTDAFALREIVGLMAAIDGGDDPRLMVALIADVLEEYGDERAESFRRLLERGLPDRRMLLACSTPEANTNPLYGEIQYPEAMCGIKIQSRGREFVFNPKARTRWYEPCCWIEKERFLELAKGQLWENDDNDRLWGYLLLDVEEMLALPGDFPGLFEVPFPSYSSRIRQAAAAL